MHRIPLPLPGDSLKAVNVYAIADGERVVLIDGGWALAEAERAARRPGWRRSATGSPTSASSSSPTCTATTTRRPSRCAASYGAHGVARRGRARPAMRALHAIDEPPRHRADVEAGADRARRARSQGGDRATATAIADWEDPDHWLADGVDAAAADPHAAGDRDARPHPRPRGLPRPRARRAVRRRPRAAAHHARRSASSSTGRRRRCATTSRRCRSMRAHARRAAAAGARPGDRLGARAHRRAARTTTTQRLDATAAGAGRRRQHRASRSASRSLDAAQAPLRRARPVQPDPGRPRDGGPPARCWSRAGWRHRAAPRGRDRYAPA